MPNNSTTSPQRNESSQGRRRSTVRGIAWGVAGLVIAVIAGFIVGANVGGNWMTGFSIGSLHGYEATAWLGAAIGGVAAAVVWFALARTRRSKQAE